MKKSDSASLGSEKRNSAEANANSGNSTHNSSFVPAIDPVTGATVGNLGASPASHQNESGIHSSSKTSNSEISKSDLESIIRGERAAVETYRQVFEKYGDDPQMDELRECSAEHKKAVDFLTQVASEHGVEIPQSSGTWGDFAEFVTGTAKAVGKTSALRALKAGEEYGKKQYKDLCDSNSLPSTLHAKVENEFLPSQEKHISCINRIIDKID